MMVARDQSWLLREKGQCERTERDLPLPPELSERSRNVGDEELEQDDRLVEGVRPNISWTVGLLYSTGCTVSKLRKTYFNLPNKFIKVFTSVGVVLFL
ncbi:hypothetical protein J6590_061200 [Homalodisca vitripennis]|nr:hypothetical protein J6590_061200 [Homalodisca vitripennis]